MRVEWRRRREQERGRPGRNGRMKRTGRRQLGRVSYQDELRTNDAPFGFGPVSMV